MKIVSSIFLGSLLVSLLTVLSPLTAEAVAPTQVKQFTTQKLIVTAANSKKFCGYLAGDASKTTICLPDDGSLKQTVGVYDAVIANDAATCGHSATGDVWKCWGAGILAGSRPDYAFLQGAKPSQVISVPDTNICRMTDKEMISCLNVTTWGNSRAKIFGPFLGLKAAAANSDALCVIDTQGVECQKISYAAAIPPSAHFTHPRLIALSSDQNCVIDDSGLQCFGPSWAVKLGQHPEWAHATQLISAFSGMCVVMPDRTVSCDFGSAPSAPSAPDARFAPLQSLKNVVELSTNAKTSVCARFTDNHVQCYGDLPQAYGVPATLNKIINISLGRDHVCAVDVDGRATCWGLNTHGQLAQGLQAGTPAKIALSSNKQCVWNDKGVDCSGGYYADDQVAIPVFNRVVQITLPNNGYSRGACALDQEANGSVNPVCWGVAKELIAQTPPELSQSAMIAMNGDNACADSENGAITCWGSDKFSNSPARTRTLSKLVMGEELACAVDAYGLSCWGPQAEDELKIPDDLAVDGAVIDVAVGRATACALTFKHEVECWGAKAGEVPELSHPIAVSSFSNGAFCATDDSGVKCWGEIYDLPGSSPGSGSQPAYNNSNISP